jgi:hypothetical protein
VKPKRRDIEGRDNTCRDIGRRDTPRRVTPELLDFHIKRAHQLRVEAWRDMWRAIGALLVRLKRLWI